MHSCCYAPPLLLPSDRVPLVEAMFIRGAWGKEEREISKACEGIFVTGR